MRAAKREAGFSLIEAMVALAVIAAMAALLFAAIDANALFARNLARRREAVLLAQSLLAQATVSGGPAQVADTGATDALRWRISRIARGGGGARDSGLPLYEIRIVVADRVTGRDLTSVRTLRLGL